MMRIFHRLGGVYVTDDILWGVDISNDVLVVEDMANRRVQMCYAFDLEISDILSTYYVDPLWKGFQRQDLLHIELEVHTQCNGASF